MSQISAAPPMVFPRYRWSDIEDALLMEVYHQSEMVGEELGWAEIAARMNASVTCRRIQVRRQFNENTVRSHWNDHQTQLLDKYSSPSGSAVFYIPPIAYHCVGPPGWVPDPVLPSREFATCT